MVTRAFCENGKPVPLTVSIARDLLAVANNTTRSTTGEAHGLFAANVPSDTELVDDLVRNAKAILDAKGLAIAC